MAIRVDDYLSPSAVAEMRVTIANADENEVFFVGKTNDKNIVENIAPFARGNQSAVPIVKEIAERGDVVVHNHPSGVLIPSQNDLFIAAELSDMGIASYIVNNTVDKIYVIIEPFSKSTKVPIDKAKLCDMLAPGGVVAQRLAGYEYRPQQIEMIEHIVDAFNSEKIAAVEAGTGVGKSMAYLIPAIYWSITNNERCVVSTNTINLQEQLIHKDIPFLQKALDVKFNAILVKGRGNYICLRKLNSLQRNQESLFPEAELQEIQALAEWAEVTPDGSKSDLNFMPKSSVWENVCAESDSCLRSFCPYFKRCFVYKAKRRANKAHILIVNHHLLFSDLAVKSLGFEIAVLPKYHHVIFDEAHNIEEIATDYFGFGVTRTGINRVFHRLHHRKEGKNLGYLNLLDKKLSAALDERPYTPFQKIVDRIQLELLSLSETLYDQNNEVMQTMFNHLNTYGQAQQMENRFRIDTDNFSNTEWRRDVLAEVNKFLSALERFYSSLVFMLNSMDSVDIVLSEDILSTKIDIDSQALRIKAIMDSMKRILLTSDEENVRWIETKRMSSGNDIVRLRLAPLNISDQMKEFVFEKFKTIILTSATLTVSGLKHGDEFSFLSRQIGLDQLKPAQINKVKIPPSFDFKNQVIMAIPTDVPDVDDRKYSEELADIIFRALLVSGGRAFVLFTSYGILNQVYQMLEPKLARQRIASLKQGQIDRHHLLQQFKKDTTSVLFGTDSFWQGVDVEGEALESVIITKLPFRVPTDPIIEARIQAIERNGGNAFMEYSVPQAVIKLKQGFGRLIRKKTDRGSVFILDKRILEKFYGRIFLQSLPNAQLVTGPSLTVLQSVEQFFKAFRNNQS
ncbi:MAG: helicase C-terminal domain-containing protein [Candidatus Zhuqueibacterota bacterium]